MKVSNTKKVTLDEIRLFLENKAQNAKIIAKDNSLIIKKETILGKVICLDSDEIEIKASPNFQNLQNAIIMAIPAGIGATLGGFIIGFIAAMLGGGLVYLIQGSKMKAFEQQIIDYISEI